MLTGSCGGLGRAMAKMIIEAGGFVIGTGLDESACSDLGDGFTFVRADLRDMNAIGQLVETVTETGVNALINNAGIMAEEPLEETTDEMWAATLDINLTAAYRLSRGLLSALRNSTPASIVNISSQLAYTGGATLTAYGASKAGLLGFTRSLAREIGPQVRVNAVAPGPTATPMTDAHLTDEWVARKTAHLIAQRMGEAHEIASVVRFLLSADSSFVNGQTISVNGGGYLS
ncbi:SDR family NAD(P)-dependent oxidoreductase [Microbacterium sp. YY-01]|uniref:SDR family NAD(P)-dependent oxidoreductase n=1 Tax=Microbacterium sp. YY-01 TaxID=3421634 RepID=UPI003D1838B3